MKLTQYEAQVAYLTAHGKRRGEIARELGRSLASVSFCRHRIRNKLGVEDPRDLRVVLLMAELADAHRRIRELEGQR